MKHLRFLVALMALIVAIALVGCGNTAAETDDSTASGSTDTATEQQAEGGESTGTVSLDVLSVNDFLNTSADIGPNTKANPVAVIPFNHIDGPKEENTFYGFINFITEERSSIKYQVSYVSCTCRPANVNYWQTIFVELSLPESKDIADAAIDYVSFGLDSSGHYNGGFWGDSMEMPSGVKYETILDEFLPYFEGKTYAQIKDLSTKDDIDADDYTSGDGRSGYSIDAFTGASVSTNNIIRILHGIFEYHGTNPYFEKGTELNNVSGGAAAPVASADAPAAAPAPVAPSAPAASADSADLPEPRDTSKSFKADKDSPDETPCGPDSFAAACSSIGSDNLVQYLGRSDVKYIDLRNYSDYSMKHFRNFEVVPFFGLIWDQDAGTDPTKTQLFGGDVKNPVPQYEESVELLNELFPKDETLFIVCQSGGRVAMLMDILNANGYDMSKVYNIGGMANYTGAEYRDYLVETSEFAISDSYEMTGLTPVTP